MAKVIDSFKASAEKSGFRSSCIVKIPLPVPLGPATQILADSFGSMSVLLCLCFSCGPVCLMSLTDGIYLKSILRMNETRHYARLVHRWITHNDSSQPRLCRRISQHSLVNSSSLSEFGPAPVSCVSKCILHSRPAQQSLSHCNSFRK